MITIREFLSEQFHENLHSHLAAGSATFVTTWSPFEDWISRAGQGVTVGVSVWVITKAITFLAGKLQKVKNDSGR